MTKTSQWFKSLMEAMGNALVHPFRDNAPPPIEPTSFSQDPYKKGLLHG